jgi:hypothetical protein
MHPTRTKKGGTDPSLLVVLLLLVVLGLAIEPFAWVVSALVVCSLPLK